MGHTVIPIDEKIDLKMRSPRNKPVKYVQNEPDAKTFVKGMLAILQQSLEFMLDLLAGGGRGQSGESASFAEMGVAIENLLEVTSATSGDKDKIAISDAHSLVLSCSWLNIKECALLASEAMIGLSPSLTDVDDFRACAEIMRKILVKVKQDFCTISVSK